jgi:hypothetical protein
VDQVIGYPRFGLAKEGTTVSVTKWSDDPEPVETLAEVWMQIRGLLPPWCEWNIIDQAVSVCGILKKIDWQSVFRDCAEVVRVQILCRDPTKIPFGRLFNFQGKLFQLQFKVEQQANQEETVSVHSTGPSDGSGDYHSGSGDGMDTDKNGGNSKEPSANNQSGNTNQIGAQGGQKTRQASGSVLDRGPVVPGHLVFDLLFQSKGVSAQAVTEGSATDEALEFWQQEEDEFVAKMQASDSMREDDVELSLPEDILPSLDQMLQQKADLGKAVQGGSKKQKIWGPIQAVRQSSRIDRSKHILEKAMELKEKKNAMPSFKKMSGIFHSNPFHVLQSSECVDMSSKLGVVINIDDDDTPSVDDSCISIDCQNPGIDKITLNQSSSIEQIIKTPEHFNTVLESDDVEDNLWIDVYRKKWGKHPRKLFK